MCSPEGSIFDAVALVERREGHRLRLGDAPQPAARRSKQLPPSRKNREAERTHGTDEKRRKRKDNMRCGYGAK
jgi:hypothetical protein